MREPNFALLSAGFFVCGFHVAFIATHLPGVVAACGLPPSVGAWSLALIGLFNIAGSFGIGWAIGRWRSKSLLSIIYATRAVAVLCFLLAPKTELTFALFAAVQWFLFHTRAGLVLRAVGESPQSAHAIGYPVIAIRYAAVLFGGACAGLAGAYLSVAYTPLWVEGMVAGRGWIALALVVFATWKPWRVLAGAYLFGGVTLAQFQAQAMGATIPSQYLAMLPYLATVVVLAVISRDAVTIRLNAPASLGKPFHPGA